MFSRLPPVTRAILIANVVVFVLQLVTGHAIDNLFALWPIGTMFQPWQVVTYAFLHANLNQTIDPADLQTAVTTG